MGKITVEVKINTFGTTKHPKPHSCMKACSMNSFKLINTFVFFLRRSLDHR